MVSFARELQRQPAGGVGAQLQHADVVERTAAQCRQNSAGRIGQGQFAVGLRVSGQRGGEGFADRADFEQGVFADRFAIFFRGNTVIKVMLLAILGDRNGEPGNVLLLHHRTDGGVDQGFELLVGLASRRYRVLRRG